MKSYFLAAESLPPALTRWHVLKRLILHVRHIDQFAFYALGHDMPVSVRHRLAFLDFHRLISAHTNNIIQIMSEFELAHQCVSMDQSLRISDGVKLQFYAFFKVSTSSTFECNKFSQSEIALI